MLFDITDSSQCNPAVLSVEPHHVLGDPGLVLVDLRTESERHGGFGFVPGSLGIPAVPQAAAYAQIVTSMIGGRRPIFVCLSGARAYGYAESISPHVDGPVGYLLGGLLEWRARELPLCGRSLTDEAPTSGSRPDVAPLHLAAELVRELAALSLGPELDPTALLRRCFLRAGVDPDAPDPTRLHRVLDQAAVTLLELGTPMSRVAEAVDRTLALLSPPAQPRVRVA